MVTMTTSNQQLIPLRVIIVVETLMKEGRNGTQLVTLGIRGFLETLQSHCSRSHEVQVVVGNCFKLLN